MLLDAGELERVQGGLVQAREHVVEEEVVAVVGRLESDARLLQHGRADVGAEELTVAAVVEVDELGEAR